jgi:glycosyltransferase involved in cell wall biosynthesis
MTICIATSNVWPQPGGIATFYKHLSSLLTKNGHTVIILTVDYTSKETSEEITTEDNGVKIVSLVRSYQRYYNYYKKYFSVPGLDAPNWIAMGLAMKEWLKENHQRYKIDIVETIDFGGLGLFLRFEQGPSVCVAGHGCLSQLSNHNPDNNDDHVRCIKKMEAAAFANADSIIAHSQMNQRDLFNCLKRTVEFCTAPWTFEKEYLPVNTASDFYLVVSGLQKTKGAVITAETLKFLQNDKHDMKVKWIGEDTYTAEKHQSMQEYLKSHFSSIWNKSFLWLGEKSPQEVRTEMAAAKAILIPSEWETFSYIALEAASLGKPIVISENAGAVYLFKNGFDALIIPAKNPAKLAEAMLYVNENEAKCSEMGSNAQKTIARAFDEKTIVHERISVYQKCMENKNPRHIDEESVLQSFIISGRKYYYMAKQMIKKMVGRG